MSPTSDPTKNLRMLRLNLLIPFIFSTETRQILNAFDFYLENDIE